MSISSSLYSSISGLTTMGNAMSVIGDNVANVDTVAFKSSRATFQDVLAQSVATASGTAQVGRGVTLSTVSGSFAQGSFESTTNPTDMAIGGQGFFMLRATGSAAADMFTRDGEFSFDQNGYLTNPSGDYVQGWKLDAKGDPQGSIGDISIGKSTPPVATSEIQAIVNLDSTTQPNNTTLFDSWNGANPTATPPTDPIDSGNYAYSSSTTVYDSKGASHDITTYFDRTPNNNQWEYLVTCDPTEDMRSGYAGTKGAGALMYGTIDFGNNGGIQDISAYNVPSDAKVDPSLMNNRLTVPNGQQYYQFDANFTGDPQPIEVNFGATYGNQVTQQQQDLVSNTGAVDGSGQPITADTPWTSVYDSSGNQMTVGDTFTYSGYKHDGTAVSGQYTIQEGDTVQKLLDQLGTSFGAKAAIDGDGRLTLTDNTGGTSEMYVTSFMTSSVSGADPFGGATAAVKNLAVTNGQLMTSDKVTPITDPSTLLTNCYDTSGNRVILGDTINLGGTDVNGAAVTATVPVTSTTTVQNLLDAMAAAYDGGTNNGDVTAVLDGTGAIRLLDNTNGGNLAPSISYTPHTDAQPFGAIGTDITTTTLDSDASGTPATAATPLTSVFDGSGHVIATGDQYTFSGTDTGGNPVTTPTFTVAAGDTVQTLLDFLNTNFDSGNLDSPSPFGLSGTGQITLADSSGGMGGNPVTLNSFTGETSTPLGPAGASVMDSSTLGQINIDTSKRQVVSPYRAFSSSTNLTPITAATSWTSVYDSSSPTRNVTPAGEEIAFSGTKGDGTTVSGTFIVGTKGSTNPDSFGSPESAATGTVQDLLDWLGTKFDANASIDSAGRLVLTDPTADTATSKSNLSLAIDGYTPPTGVSTAAQLFGGPASISAPVGFQTIQGDLSQDGSQQGGAVDSSFSQEALSSTQYANASTTIYQDQDGYASGFLQSVSVDTSGVITGHYSNGQVLKKAQVALATFNNLEGLKKEGGNIFTQTTESGAPVTGAPGTNGLGSIAPNSLEQSNVDLGTQFVKLISTQRGFEANSKVITTTDTMMSDLINIIR